MIKPEHLREEVIKPTLMALSAFNPKLGADPAVELLMGTAATESDMGYNLVREGGPALGIYQIESATHEDIKRYLNRPDNANLLAIVRGMAPDMSDGDLVGNLYYATAIARIKYWMIPEPLPENPDQHAIYWKSYYTRS